MRTLFLAFFCLCYLLPYGNGQDNSKEEVITYTNGSVFKGKVLEKSESLVYFRLSTTGDTLKLKRTLIKKWIDPDNHFMYADGKYHNKKGYIKVFRYGIGGNVSDVTMQADFAYAMLLNQKLAIGMGLGYSLSTITSHSWENLSFGEIFLYSRYYVNDKKKRFFADAKIGAGLQLDSRPLLKYSSGPLFQPGIGFQFATRRRVKWELGLRQLIQATKIHDHDGFLLRDQIIVNEIQLFQNVVEKRILSRTILSFSLIL